MEPNIELLIKAHLFLLSKLVEDEKGVPLGPSGTNGLGGPSGTNGLGGPSGTNGFGGPSGTNGFGGPSGTNGLGGPSGTNGLGGPSGTNGLGGPSGTNGLGGPSGTNVSIRDAPRRLKTLLHLFNKNHHNVKNEFSKSLFQGNETETGKLFNKLSEEPNGSEIVVYLESILDTKHAGAFKQIKEHINTLYNKFLLCYFLFKLGDVDTGMIEETDEAIDGLIQGLNIDPEMKAFVSNFAKAIISLNSKKFEDSHLTDGASIQGLNKTLELLQKYIADREEHLGNMTVQLTTTQGSLAETTTKLVDIEQQLLVKEATNSGLIQQINNDAQVFQENIQTLNRIINRIIENQELNDEDLAIFNAIKNSKSEENTETSDTLLQTRNLLLKKQGEQLHALCEQFEHMIEIFFINKQEKESKDGEIAELKRQEAWFQEEIVKLSEGRAQEWQTAERYYQDNLLLMQERNDLRREIFDLTDMNTRGMQYTAQQDEVISKNDKMIKTLNGFLQQAGIKITADQGELGRLRGKNENDAMIIEHQQKTILALAQQLQDKTRESSNKNAQIAELENTLEDAEQDIEKSEQLRELNRNSYEYAFETIRKQMDDQRAELFQKNRRIDQLESELDTSKEENTLLTLTITRGENEINALNATIVQNEATIQQINDDTVMTLDQLRDRYSQTIQQVSNLYKGKITSVTAELKNKEQIISQLEGINTSLKEGRQRDTVAQAAHKNAAKELEKEKANMQREIALLKDTTGEQVAQLKTEIDGKNGELTKLIARANQAEGNAAAEKKRANQAEGNAVAERQRAIRAESQVKQLTQEIVNKRQAIQGLTSQVRKSGADAAEIQRISKDLEELEKQLAESKQQIGVQNSEMIEYLTRLKDLTTIIRESRQDLDSLNTKNETTIDNATRIADLDNLFQRYQHAVDDKDQLLVNFKEGLLSSVKQVMNTENKAKDNRRYAVGQLKDFPFIWDNVTTQLRDLREKKLVDVNRISGLEKELGELKTEIDNEKAINERLEGIRDELEKDRNEAKEVSLRLDEQLTGTLQRKTATELKLERSTQNKESARATISELKTEAERTKALHESELQKVKQDAKEKLTRETDAIKLERNAAIRSKTDMEAQLAEAKTKAREDKTKSNGIILGLNEELRKASDKLQAESAKSQGEKDAAQADVTRLEDELRIATDKATQDAADTMARIKEFEAQLQKEKEEKNAVVSKLKGELEKATATLTESSTKSQGEKEAAQAEVKRLQGELNKASATEIRLKGKIGILESTLKDERQKLIGERAASTKKIANIEREVFKQTAELVKELWDQEKTIVNSRTTVEQLTTTLANTEEKLRLTTLEKNDLERKLTASRSEEVKKKQELAASNENLRRLQENNDELRQQAELDSNAKLRLQTVEQELFLANTENKKIKQQLEELQGQIVSIDQKLTIAKADAASMKQQLEGSQEETVTIKQQLEDAKANVVATAQQLANTQADAAATAQQLATAQADAATTKQQLATTQADADRAKEQLATAQADAAESKVKTDTAQKQLKLSQGERIKVGLQLKESTQEREKIGREISDLILELGRLRKIEEDFTLWQEGSDARDKAYLAEIEMLQTELTQISTVSGIVEIRNKKNELQSIVDTIKVVIDDRIKAGPIQSPSGNVISGDHATVVLVLQAVTEKIKHTTGIKLPGQKP